MAKIQWDESLSIGVNLIDEQHKMLLQRLNDLSVAIEMSHGVEKIVKTLDFMVDYTDFHFSDEEKQMTLHEYPGLEYQQKQHEEFKNKLKQIVEDFEEEGATQDLATSINVFLYNWLVNHIKGVDHKYGEFLNEKGTADNV